MIVVSKDKPLYLVLKSLWHVLTHWKVQFFKKMPIERVMEQDTLTRMCRCTRVIHLQGQLYYEGSVEVQQGYKPESEGTFEVKI